MDELALKLGMDPVQLRLVNEPKIDEGLKIPFSSRHLKECLATGAEKFGWSKRNPRVGSMQRDALTLGWGMAACSWIAERFACVGTGTYTIFLLRSLVFGRFPTVRKGNLPTQFNRYAVASCKSPESAAASAMNIQPLTLLTAMRIQIHATR
jgi:hypothetical protein